MIDKFLQVGLYCFIYNFDVIWLCFPFCFNAFDALYFFSFQLDYKVDVKKLRQVFKLAGRIIDVELSVDKDGNSRGFAVVEFDHPVEAVQAISMFDHQLLFDRRMTVRLDRIPDKEKLPEGLGGIGMGLGPNGEPLRNVALNLPSLQNNSLGSNNSNNAPVPVAAPPTFSSASNVLSQTQNPNLNNLAALNNVVGNLNNLNPLLSTLGLSSLASNTNDSSSSAGIDITKIVGGNSSGSSAGINNVVSGSNTGNYSSLGGGLNQPNRLDASLSNAYNSTFNSLSSNITGGLSNQSSGYGSNQRDFDMSGSLRNYNSQSDDFNRLSSQNFGSSGLGNGAGAANQSSGNTRSNISDTILIRNVSTPCFFSYL